MLGRTVFVDLGHGTAKIVVSSNKVETCIEFTAPAYERGGGFFPAASFRIFGEKNVLALREILNEVFKSEQEG